MNDNKQSDSKATKNCSNKAGSKSAAKSKGASNARNYTNEPTKNSK